MADDVRQIQQNIEDIRLALQTAQVWAESVFTHWQGETAAATAQEMKAFYGQKADTYMRALAQQAQKMQREARRDG